MGLPIYFTLWFGCNPWQDIYDREQQWRTDVQQRPIPQLSISAPIKHAPRITISTEAIEFDNRAWWLSLPDEFYLTTSDEVSWFEDVNEKRRLLIETTVLPLQNGRIASKELRGSLVLALAEVLSRQVDNNKMLGERRSPYPSLEETEAPSQPEASGQDTPSVKDSSEGARPSETILADLGAPVSKQAQKITPKRYTRDEAITAGINGFRFSGEINIVVEQNVPMETVQQVLYTSGQSQFSSMTLTGLQDGKLVGVVPHPTDPTDPREVDIDIWGNGYDSKRCTVHVETDRSWLQCGERSLRQRTSYPPLALGKTCTGNDWKALLETVREFQTDCYAKANQTPAYPKHYHVSREDYRANQPITDDSIRLFVNLTADIPYQTFVELFTFAYEAYPQFKVNYFPIFVSPEAEDLCPFAINMRDLSEEQTLSVCNHFFQTTLEAPDFAALYPQFEQWRQEHSTMRYGR